MTTLVVGSVLGVAGVVANSYVPGLAYAGVGIAIVAGVVAAVLAWRAHGQVVYEAGEREVEMLRGFTARLHDERVTNNEVLGLIEGRNAELGAELTATRLELGGIRQDLSELRGDYETLAHEHFELKISHDALLDQVKAESGSDIVSLPRRRTVDGEEVTWEEAPTVAELNLQRLVAPFVAEEVRQAN